MSFLDHIAACNRHDPGQYLPFLVAATTVGRVRRDVARLLADHPRVFAVNDRAVTLAPALVSPGERSRAVAEVAAGLAVSHGIPCARGEDYRVVRRWGEAPLMLVDRNLVSLFGLTSYGVHVNGIVGGAAQPSLWIARRAADRPVAPGKLDNMIAGGQPAGLTLADNLVKEAAEEAGLSEVVARTARPVGAIRYCCEDAWGLKPDTMFCFDLNMPAGLVPRNTDGEVESFHAMAVSEVAARVRDTQDFKFNVNLVLIDFLIRHGHLGPDSEPDYVELVSGLRQGN